MKRALLLLIAGAGVAVAAWYAVHLATFASNEAVAQLLPRGTVLLLHAPDISRTRNDWHQSDVYQLYREPAVQDFLRKPLSRVTRTGAAFQTLKEIEELNLTDGFFALTSVEQTNLKCVAGFHFKGSEQEAERVIGKWRTHLLDKNTNAKRETIEYERHKIDTVAIASFTFASAYDGHWFFAANDLAELKAMLDRADQRNKDQSATLETDESYRAAKAHMPPNYAALFFLQPKTLAQQLQSLQGAIGSPVSPKEQSFLQKINSVCGTMRFDNGKMHDVFFVGMPRIDQTPALTRSSLNLGSKDTVFYLAAMLNVGEKIDAIAQTPAIGDRIQRLFQTFAESGITADDWKAAFGLELGSLADWPATSSWPTVVATLPVLDVGKASKIVDAAMRIDEDSFWARTERDGVRYFSMQSPASLIAITPTVALSDRVMVVGLSAAAVEAAIKRSRSSDAEFASGQSFKTAARLVPPPTNFFSYVDTALLYTRLDSTVRPLLLMAAAFMPGVSEYVDLDKFPAAELITKHLSPIVSSQRYDRDGYVLESAGPVTLNQAAIGFAGIGIGVAKDDKTRGILPKGFPGFPAPSPSGTP
ncbi:MAG: hypothetical protein ABI925_09920 [Verrucomicrobiota bacterium]